MGPEQRLDLIRELHSPEYPPPGKIWLGGSSGQWMGAPEIDPENPTPRCRGCATGDPYLDSEWPCETRRIADGLDEQ